MYDMRRPFCSEANDYVLLGTVHKKRPHKIAPSQAPCPKNVRTASTPLLRADTT